MASGRALADLGYWELAAHAFQRVTEISPDYPDAWAYLGEARQHLDSGSQGSVRDELIPELQTALQLDPNSLAANIFAALYWGRNGQPERALEMLELAAGVDPDNPALLADLGRTLATLGDLQGAQSYYQEAIELTPNDPTYLRALAEFSLRYNYYVREIAVPTAREALSLDRDNPASLDLMGQVMLVLGDYRSAERFLNQAVGSDPTYALAHIHLGTLYLLEEDTGRAREHIDLARSFAVDPSTAEHARRMWEDLFSHLPPDE
jgi:tetratricopeptide (TPR) repeat protein